MTTQNPQGADGSTPEFGQAAPLRDAPSGGKTAVEDRTAMERRIVERCLSGDERSWERLYRKCHPRLRKTIELLMGREAPDVNVIEEIAARVWYALLKDNRRLLAAYDADRESELDGFFMGLARIEILRYTRAERRRLSHELSGGRKRLEEERVSDWQLANLMEEFASTLTPRERDFMEHFLMASDESDAGLADLPPTTIWTRRHRIRRKLDRFLDNL